MHIILWYNKTKQSNLCVAQAEWYRSSLPTRWLLIQKIKEEDRIVSNNI